MMDLVKEIKKLQQELISLAETENKPLDDPEIYKRSCKIDRMIVQLMKKAEKE